MLSKKQKKAREVVKPGTQYPFAEAITILKDNASKKFNETIEVAINLGVDSKKSDQVVRGATKLPKGTGKTVRVAVFAQGDNAEKAKAAGADIVGFDDLAEQIKAGKIDFDVLIATPDAMRVIAPLGQILGPKGLMPNPKVGTVTVNVKDAVEDTKSGRVMYRTDKNGIIHCLVGKMTFTQEDIKENLNAILADLRKAKPATAKGVYIKKLTLTSTMGPGIPIDLSSIAV